MGDTIKLIISILFIFGIVISLVFIGSYSLTKKVCLDSYSNFEPEFGIWTNCRISVEGVMTPVDIVRELN